MTDIDYRKKPETSEQTQKRADNDSKWKNMLAMLNFAQTGDPMTLLGYGLGNLIRDGWLSMKKGKQDETMRGATAAADAYNQGAASGLLSNGVSGIQTQGNVIRGEGGTEGIKTPSTAPSFNMGIGKGEELPPGSAKETPSVYDYKAAFNEVLGPQRNDYLWNVPDLMSNLSYDERLRWRS